MLKIFTVSVGTALIAFLYSSCNENSDKKGKPDVVDDATVDSQMDPYSTTSFAQKQQELAQLQEGAKTDLVQLREEKTIYALVCQQDDQLRDKYENKQPTEKEWQAFLDARRAEWRKVTKAAQKTAHVRFFALFPDGMSVCRRFGEGFHQVRVKKDEASSHLDDALASGPKTLGSHRLKVKLPLALLDGEEEIELPTDYRDGKTDQAPRHNCTYVKIEYKENPNDNETKVCLGKAQLYAPIYKTSKKTVLLIAPSTFSSSKGEQGIEKIPFENYTKIAIASYDGNGILHEDVEVALPKK